jgi:hypothetical protein
MLKSIKSVKQFEKLLKLVDYVVGKPGPIKIDTDIIANDPGNIYDLGEDGKLITIGDIYKLLEHIKTQMKTLAQNSDTDYYIYYYKNIEMQDGIYKIDWSVQMEGSDHEYG